MQQRETILNSPKTLPFGVIWHIFSAKMADSAAALAVNRQNTVRFWHKIFLV